MKPPSFLDKIYLYKYIYFKHQLKLREPPLYSTIGLTFLGDLKLVILILHKIEIDFIFSRRNDHIIVVSIFDLAWFFYPGTFYKFILTVNNLEIIGLGNLHLI